MHVHTPGTGELYAFSHLSCQETFINSEFLEGAITDFLFISLLLLAFFFKKKEDLSKDFF